LVHFIGAFSELWSFFLSFGAFSELQSFKRVLKLLQSFKAFTELFISLHLSTHNENRTCNVTWNFKAFTFAANFDFTFDLELFKSTKEGLLTRKDLVWLVVCG
jgi:hypothetical protein